MANKIAPITKTCLHSGKQYIPISNGSKVYFHFQTWKHGAERTLLDDSRIIGKKEPMVLVIGHKFKLEVWEQIVKMMSVGEVSSFVVKKELVYSYPFISKTLRELGTERPERKHTCTMTLHTEGIGYRDLDELLQKPCELEFIIELIKVENPEEYEKELWQLNETERLDLIPKLREEGNALYKKSDYGGAEECYQKAISILEQMILKEKPNDVEWNALQKMKIPILLNYVQCKLIASDFYAVIEHCNTILKIEPDNEKALYRRGRAHVGAWNLDKAEADFKKLKEINPSLNTMLDRELVTIQKLRATKDQSDKEALKNMFSKQ